MEGRVINEIHPYKKESEIMKCAESKHTGMPHVFFFDEHMDERKYRITKTLSKSFWYYQFEAGNRQYIVLSEDRLDLENCKIEGTIINLKDDTLIGENKKFSINLPIFIANKVTKNKIEIKSKKELIEITKKSKLSHKNYFNWLFYHSEDKKVYNHPDYFQYLISAWLLSSKRGFPLHLMVIAEPGTGKSTVQECIWQKFDEDVEIVEGSCSTMKSLIPSFKGTLPEPGALLRANRICVVDELFRILMRTKRDLREIELSSTNPILEHKKNRRVSSGNGEIKFNPSARVIGVTNPVWGSSNMQQLTDHFDNSFLSRWLIWYQDHKHVKMIQDGESVQESQYKLDRDVWLSMVDYLHSFEAKFDKNKVKELFEQCEKLLGNYTEENELNGIKNVYSARYRHHIECLMDGIVKTRCICEQDDSFSAKKIDYENLKKIWVRMMIEWGIYHNNSIQNYIIDVQKPFY
jgi:ribosomal protein L21